MASLIETYYAHAQLSDAAYALLVDGMSGQSYINALRERGFTAAEATAFAAQYSIVKTFEDLNSSFFAVLFQKNGTNQKVLAIRGTQEPFDFLTDAELALLGVTDQNVSLRLSYPQIVAQLEPTDTLTVTGHSLGGFLAQVLSAEPPVPISHVYTYNAPGIGAGKRGHSELPPISWTPSYGTWVASNCTGLT